MTTELTDRVDAEHGNWQVAVEIAKWSDAQAHADGAAPDSIDHFENNLLLNAGITRLLNLLIGAGGTAFNAANSRIGVGTGTTAASASQTDLIGSGANKYYKLVDSVSVTGQVATWVATFGSGVANFAWEEWGIDNGTADSATAAAPMLNRKAVTMGTKASGSVWTMTVTITIS